MPKSRIGKKVRDAIEVNFAIRPIVDAVLKATKQQKEGETETEFRGRVAEAIELNCDFDEIVRSLEEVVERETQFRLRHIADAIRELVDALHPSAQARPGVANAQRRAQERVACVMKLAVPE